MITKRSFVDYRGRLYSEFYGLSTDDKNEAVSMGVENADSFLEMDTRRVYLFDEENEVWQPLKV